MPSFLSISITADSEIIQIEDNVPECFDHDVDFNNDSIVVQQVIL